MYASFLKILVTAFSVVLFVVGNANAVVKTITFEATDIISNANLSDVFSILDMGTQGTVTGSFSFDTEVSFGSGPGGSGVNENFISLAPYTDFTVQIGSVTLHGAPSNPLHDAIYILDGIGSNVPHEFLISSETEQSLPGSLSGTLDGIYLALFSTLAANPFDGVSVPTAAILNSLAFDGVGFSIYVGGNGGHYAVEYSSITFFDTPAVPVPAALPLFGTGLVIMGFIGWRKKRKLS